MKIYVFSLAAGVLVGAIYGLLGVRSPAPPIVALVGLLGILIGEQAVPFARHLLGPGHVQTSPYQAAREHLFGRLPGHCDRRGGDKRDADA